MTTKKWNQPKGKSDSAPITTHLVTGLWKDSTGNKWSFMIPATELDLFRRRVHASNGKIFEKSIKHLD